MYQNVLVITDNFEICNQFYTITKEIDCGYSPHFTYSCTVLSDYKKISQAIYKSINLQCINVKLDYEAIIQQYDLVISAHCKQLFPKELVNQVKCINIHPGLNPYNRGWFPQVFSILNKLPLGATIHEIDEELDHGRIIAQEEVSINSYDTSLTAYNKVIQAEFRLLKKHLKDILLNTYTSISPMVEGNVNYKKDFNQLCILDTSKEATVGEIIDLLRALTHGSYHNAYFIDKNTGKKIYVSIQLTPEELL